MTQSFSKQKIIPLRKAFSADGQVVGKEATDFTPWLCKDDNLNNYLGEALGMNLKEPKKESKVGRALSLDILCTNTKDTSWVAIENQFGTADHRHLGQLLTYGAGLKTPTMIWIAEDFTEEHLVALKWLNKKTDTKTSFFAVKVQAIKIGDSPTAIVFSVVGYPTDWRKPRYHAKQKATKETKSSKPFTKDLRLLYWQNFEKHLKAKNSKLRPQSPIARIWQRVSTSAGSIYIEAKFNKLTNEISVFINMEHPKHAKTYFKFLERDKKAIELAIGFSLDWREMPEKKSSKIAVYKSADPKDEADWDKQHAWLKEMMESFDIVFGERIKAIAQEIKTQ